MTKARSCDWLNRLMGITSVPSGANQLPLSFDKYTNRTVPGYVDVLGIGTSTAAVTVNGTGAYRRGEYFHVALPVDNSSGPQYPSIVIQAVAGANSASSTGSVFLARTPETFVHDADGNLIQDGHWTYTWDGENRLVTMQALDSLPSAAKLRVEYEYDWRGRRIGKTVKAWSASTYTNAYVLKFLYDGWNLVAELDANNVLVRSYLWGTDLSGSFQGAGGVGGLLAINVATNGVHFPAYDGNGNIAGLISSASGAITARYEYGPFAEPIRVSGQVARAMPLRFSTKYLDDETGLYYYGYRYYNSSMGRWLSRDPIGERGGKNLYGFGRNSPITGVDPLGNAWYNPFSWFEPEDGGIVLPDGTVYYPPLPLPPRNPPDFQDEIDAQIDALSGRSEQVFQFCHNTANIGYEALEMLPPAQIYMAGTGKGLDDRKLGLHEQGIAVAGMLAGPEWKPLYRVVGGKIGGACGKAWRCTVGKLFAAKTPAPRFLVTESGVAVPTRAAELKSNLQLLQETSTSPATSRKFVGVDSQGPLRVRIEQAHPSTPGYTGPIDPLHTVDHLHIDRRLNGTTGPWQSSEKLPYDWPF